MPTLKSTRIILPVLLFLLIASGCGSDDGPTPLQGEFLALTYNVAGLPGFLSGSDPEKNTPLMSPLLNGYDLVLVQEDFWYHDDLIARVDHPFQSDPMWDRPTLFRMGDGLNRFSIFPLGELTRTGWAECSGLFNCSFDCLTTKGFSLSEVHPAEGVAVDLYNLHLDAGSCDGDFDAREVQVEQLLQELTARAGEKALIIAGDTNLKPHRPEDMVLFERLLAEGDLQDACRFLDCGIEIHDRFLFRSSDSLSLVPLSWEHPGEFVDDQGEDLSDHKPVALRFQWESVR
ncbi:hypothetical protein ACFL4G_07305 [Thermodesulfobacteriota bacterium]